MQVTVVNESLLLTADDLEEETMFSSLGACGPDSGDLLLDPDEERFSAVHRRSHMTLLRKQVGAGSM